MNLSKQFYQWLGSSSAEPFVYYRGALARDMHWSRYTGETEAMREAGVIAGECLAMSLRDQLYLVQRRHGEFDYSYIAIKPQVVQARAA